MKVLKYRDLTVCSTDGVCIVCACDSCGGVGEKQGDVLKYPAYITGRYTARGALMEIISYGCKVVSVSDTVCCEMLPTGKEIIRGVIDEMALAGIDKSLLNGSTEENMTTTMTGVGVSVIGLCDKPRQFEVNAGDFGVLFGKIKSGSDILDTPGVIDEEIICYDDIKAIRNIEKTAEIVPIGSKGIKYEALLLSKLHNLKFEFSDSFNGDILKSGGPSTAALVSVKEENLDKVLSLKDTCVVLGRFI